MTSEQLQNMTVAEAIQYCYDNRDKFIRDFDDIDDGIRQFNCLITILESGTISPSELPNYGMEY